VKINGLSSSVTASGSSTAAMTSYSESDCPQCIADAGTFAAEFARLQQQSTSSEKTLCNLVNLTALSQAQTSQQCLQFQLPPQCQNQLLFQPISLTYGT